VALLGNGNETPQRWKIHQSTLMPRPALVAQPAFA